MSGHTLPLPSFHARYRLGNMLRKVRRRWHHPSEDRLPGQEQPVWLPETRAVYQLRQVFVLARRHARNLGAFRALLPTLANDLPVASAVMFRLLLSLEGCEPDCLSWPLDPSSLDALLGMLPASQLQGLLDQVTAQAELSCDSLCGQDSNRLCAPQTGADFWIGLAGNGYLQAGIMALALHPAGSEMLGNMIRPNSDHNAYFVSFPGQTTVLMPSPTATEKLLFLNAGSQGYWPALLEKAAACLWPAAFSQPDEGPGPLLGAALELLSGLPATLLDTSMTSLGMLRVNLSQAFARGQMVVAACNQYPWLASGVRLPAEAYAVTAYDPEQDLLQLYRARGQHLPQDAQGNVLAEGQAGLLSVTLADFAACFSHVAMSTVV